MIRWYLTSIGLRSLLGASISLWVARFCRSWKRRPVSHVLLLIALHEGRVQTQLASLLF